MASHVIEQAAALDRLANLAGIEALHSDFYGREERVSDQTKLELLAAMGFDVATEEGLERSAAALEDRPWQRTLEPVYVASADAALLRFALVLPADETAERTWRFIEESGKTHAGTFVASALTANAARTVDGVAYERRTLEIAPHAPAGYHRLEIADESAVVIVAPSRAFLPSAIERGAKLWGLAAQLYSLRSRRNWGIGDFTDLRNLAALARQAGAAALGVNPLHELDPANPEAASPYSASSRYFLNGQYLDVESIPEFERCEPAQTLTHSDGFARNLSDLRQARLVDYRNVAARKREVLDLLYATFRGERERGSRRTHAFETFLMDGGAALERLVTFEALREHFVAQGYSGYGWSSWPAEYRSPELPAVLEFARTHRERLDFFAYVQWNAHEQLARAAAECRLMDIGLYCDLAVGSDADGSDGWSDREVMLPGVTIGAPPDPLNVQGQNWGLAPLSPLVLREQAYAPFIALLRANMRYAGALRIDHVMALQRLFWIPRGRSASAGAYVRYPFADLLAIVNLESERNRCLVVGEDLGTVPDGFRERLQRARVFSYRLLHFERASDGSYKRSDEYPALALVSPGTHDLPTLPAFWLGRDLALRGRLGLLPPGQSATHARDERQLERDALLNALLSDGALTVDAVEGLRSAAEGEGQRAAIPAIVEASYRFLAHSPARLLMASIEDVLGVVDQTNVPGTVFEHPNWRRKLPRALEELARDPRFAAFASALHDVRALPAPPTVPSATYRLQFHSGFKFTDAERLVPYLANLGISHVYASPFLAARSGSSHGYDIVDHNAFNPEIGTRPEFERFVDALHRHGMGLLLDFVPNHMGVGSENPWWMDVLEWGRNSPYAPFFDIDWHPGKREMRDRVLLPFLGSAFGAALERGELKLRFDRERGSFSITYHEMRFPVTPSSYVRILGPAVDLGRELPGGVPLALAQSADAFAHTNWNARSSRRRNELRARADGLKAQLALGAQDPAVSALLETTLERMNGEPGDSASFAALARLLRAQPYRPAFWRVALDEINYRRFFDINDLAGLRVEYAECFAEVHQLAFKLIEDGRLQGLRIDHIDGLFDPKAYCTLLRMRSLALDHPLYLIVEKILARREHLRSDWLVAGTTGYEFANLLNGLFVDGRNEARLDLMYRAFTGDLATFDQVLLECKRLIVDVDLASELYVLANELDRIAQTDVHSSDYTLSGLRTALADVVCAFPVYRTYVDGDGASADDRRYIEQAVAQARRASATPDRTVFDFIASILTTDAARDPRVRYKPRDVLHFAMKFQQYTSPVMAKALEDTSFYRYVRLLSLNEVGGDPRRFGVSVGTFHHAMKERGTRLPYALSSTSTHDTKRSEDVRARINVLSELPSAGRRALQRLERLNRRFKREIDGAPAPDRNDEWLFYQTLLGAWPLELASPADLRSGALDDLRARLLAYMHKAIREAKRHTSWSNPNTPYEEAVAAFVRGVLDDSPAAPLWTEFFRIAEPVMRIGMLNSLAQTTLKLTAPGVPDTYLGTELWDFSLVDPDNRRPVDWALREKLALELPDEPASAEFAATVLNGWRDGHVKLFVTRTLLRLRRARREMFLSGDYTALETAGPRAEHLVAFSVAGTTVAVPRLIGGLLSEDPTFPLGDVWDATRVTFPRKRSRQRYHDVFTGRVHETRTGDGAALQATALFADFPVAVLVPEEPR